MSWTDTSAAWLHEQIKAHPEMDKKQLRAWCAKTTHSPSAQAGPTRRGCGLCALTSIRRQYALVVVAEQSLQQQILKSADNSA